MGVLTDKRVLLVNDDGIDAPGIKLLEELVSPLVGELWVIAPDGDRSASARHISLRQDICARNCREQHYTISGTPSDCVLIALAGIMKSRWPDIVLSGINAGGNLGEDIGYSGTVGAGFEAHQNAIPALCFSQEYQGLREKMSFDAAKTHLPKLLDDLARFALKKKALLNVNFPPIMASQIKGVRVAHQGKRADNLDLEERKDSPPGERHFYFSHMRSGIAQEEGSDLDAVCHDYIAVTPLSNHYTALNQLTALTAALNLHR